MSIMLVYKANVVIVTNKGRLLSYTMYLTNIPMINGNSELAADPFQIFCITFIRM